MKGKDVVIIVSVIAFVLLLSLAITIGGLGYVLPLPNVREVASWYLRTTYNPFMKLFSAMAPEGVTAIVWDYRGLDTLFETAVFFLAIIGSVAIMRDIVVKGKYDPEKHGMSLIVKTVTRIVVVLIIAVAGSIALHGHLTPGGGFQGGAAAAVAPLLVLVVFSKYFMDKIGVSKNAMLVIRSVGLIGIGLTAFAALMMALAYHTQAYVFQNQPKPYAPAGFPYKAGTSLLGGSLLFFNACEMFAVAAGFTIVFLLLALPEKEVIKVLRGERVEH